MPKIDLSFDEFLDVVGCMISFIDEIDHVIPEEAHRLQRLYDELQQRYAKATVDAELHTEDWTPHGYPPRHREVP